MDSGVPLTYLHLYFFAWTPPFYLAWTGSWFFLPLPLLSMCNRSESRLCMLIDRHHIIRFSHLKYYSVLRNFSFYILYSNQSPFPIFLFKLSIDTLDMSNHNMFIAKNSCIFKLSVYGTFLYSTLSLFDRENKLRTFLARAHINILFHI